MEKLEMIVDVVLNFPFQMVNLVNVILNQRISVVQNGASVVVIQSIVIAQLALTTGFWANDGMLYFHVPWKFQYLV